MLRSDARTQSLAPLVRLPAVDHHAVHQRPNHTEANAVDPSGHGEHPVGRAGAHANRADAPGEAAVADEVGAAVARAEPARGWRREPDRERTDHPQRP